MMFHGCSTVHRIDERTQGATSVSTEQNKSIVGPWNQNNVSRNVALVLPWPVSANRYWRTRVVKGIAMTYISAEAKAYKATVRSLAKIAGVKAPIAGRVAVAIRLYPNRPQDWAKRAAKDPMGWDDTVQCLDLDNANKVLFDALKGVVIEDDRWVRRITAERMEPDGEARVEIVVEPMETVSPQGDLL